MKAARTDPPLLRSAVARHRAGDVEQAEALYRRCLAAEPRHAVALHLLGMLRHERGGGGEALDLLRKSLELAPQVPDFHNDLGVVLGESGRAAEAAESFREAVRLRPDYAEAHNNLGVALETLGRSEEAVAAHRGALRLRPGYADCWNNLGNALRKAGRVGEAEAAHREALAAEPRYAAAYLGLATLLQDQGRLDEVIDCYRSAERLGQGRAAAEAGSGLLLALHYRDGDDPERLFREHRAWADRHARPLYPPRRPAAARAGRQRPRVGYVSCDLRAHPVARFLEPLLAAHDRDAVQVFCYSDTAAPDATTDRLRGLTDYWRETRGLDDAALARAVEGDGVDVLVDLGGHMSGNRLLAFARRPARVQVTYLGYPNTTGLATMDYRVTDSLHDPPGATEQFHAEELVRLDPCCWCYAPEAESAAPVGELPADRAGRVTFGCLNRMAKVTQGVLRLWRSVLGEVEGSRLLVLVEKGSGSAVSRMLAAAGIAPERVTLVTRSCRLDYLSLHNEVDVALDTFPYNGHTTTCDALWMGVPVVSMAGRTHVARAGLSVLRAVGLGGMVADRPEGYVAAAAGLAGDRERLRGLRHTLRDRVKSSPLTDGAGLARRMEAAYHMMWERHCS